MRIKLFGLSLLVAFIGLGLFMPRIQAAPTDPEQNGSIGLEGTVTKNPPSVGATITFPNNGQSFTTLPISIGGSCTGDVLVKLFKNEVFAGAAECKNGTFSISTDLFNGKNDLIARVYDALDQVGPSSNVVSVTFTQNGFNNNAPRVTLTSDYARRGADPGQTLSWPIILSGGKGPFAVSINWGDGVTDLKSLTNIGTFTVEHVYKQSGSYIILFKVTDTDGNSAFLQLVGVANGAAAQDNKGSNDNTVTKVIVIWWPLIVAGLLIILSFFFGRQAKLVELRKQAEKRIQY